MQGRGGQYGWNRQNQYYGYSGYPQQNYGQQGYPPQQQQYGHQQPYAQQQGYASSNSQFQPPTGPAQNSGPPQAPRANMRGGSNARGSRVPYSNMSWKASEDNRRPLQHEEMRSVIAAPSEADDTDNPFRPPLDLRAEDEEVEKERKRAAKRAEDEAAAVKRSTSMVNIPTEPRNKGKISFSIKPRDQSVADTGQSSMSTQLSPIATKHNPIVDSPLDKPSTAKSRSHDSETKPDAAPRKAPVPTPRTKTVKRKVLKTKPVLSEEHAQSESVYHRKTGNESVVGSGTYGKVYKATHVYTGKMVALKKIRMEGERDGFPVTAIREIKLLQSLRHRNVVPLREVMVERNDCYMVFEYLHHDLTGLLNHPSFVLSAAHKKHLAKQLFEGLDYLHRRGVLHRDIKAANILISKTGELKLADFGLARFYQKRTKEDYTNRVITIWYRPPELLLGETQYDGAVDIWSAACVLVEIFLRHAIFPGNGSEIDQLDKIYHVLGTPSRSEWPGIVELQWYELLRPSQRIESTFAQKFRDRVSPEAFELLQAMFLYDPANRPTAADVLDHAYFTTEEPAPAQAVELENLEGDWHEFESKQLRKEKEKQERKRRDRDRESEKRKRDESAGGESKKLKITANEA